MRRDSRLSDVLHVLLHMAEFEEPATSERLAAMLRTNPVVVRRILGGLRDLGLVASGKGHGGGWTISCDLDRVTLHDIYVAIGSPDIFAMGQRSEAPACLVEQSVNAALSTTFREAEALLLSRLGEVTLGQLSADFHARFEQRGQCGREARTDVA